MSMYRCADCEDVLDSDYIVCHESPDDDTLLICEDCDAIREEEEETAREELD